MTQPEPGSDRDLTRRTARIRRQRLLLTLERWGPGHHRVTGNGLRYVAEIAHASPAEHAWLAAHVAARPETWDAPYRSDAEWTALRRQQADDALVAADAAYTAGDWATARDRVDDAYAYGGIDEDQWRRLHDAITTAAHADGPR